MPSAIGPLPDREPAGTVVVAIGDEAMRDHGIGPAIARELSRRDLGPKVRVADAGMRGLDLVFELQGAGRVVIVCALQTGASPGTIHVMSPATAVALGRTPSLSGLELADALEMTGLLGERPEALILGVEPSEIAPGRALSPAVAPAIGPAVDRVLALIADPVAFRRATRD